MIEGERIRLRAPVEGDTGAIAAMRNDLALQEAVMGTPHPNTAEMAREWMAAKLADPRTIFFVVAARADDRPLGYVMVAGVDPLHGHGELGICLAPGDQGRGYGSEALGLLETYVRAVFALRKVHLRVRADLARAIALYRKSGYREVGTLRAHHYASGVHHDVLIMEKLLL